MSQPRASANAARPPGSTTAPWPTTTRSNSHSSIRSTDRSATGRAFFACSGHRIQQLCDVRERLQALHEVDRSRSPLFPQNMLCIETELIEHGITREMHGSLHDEIMDGAVAHRDAQASVVIAVGDVRAA